MTQAFDDIAAAEQACIESHLPPDPRAAVLLVALKNWHLQTLHRDHPQLLPDLYPLLDQFGRLTLLVLGLPAKFFRLGDY